MPTGQLPSHIQAASELLERGRLDEALREAELAVDEYWKLGDEAIVEALPLYSMLQHATGSNADVFESLDDLPTSFSARLISKANKLNEQFRTEASEAMLEDVHRFLERWLGEQANVEADVREEKIDALVAEIKQLKSDGKLNLALETSLQLANEFAVRGNRHRAFRTFRQVLRKSKSPERVALRIDALVDFGQFVAQLENYKDAVYSLKLAAGVAKKARDKERFAQAVAALGIVLMHTNELDSAKRYLKKANSLLDPWDLEANIVKEHLEAIREGKACDCLEVSRLSSSFSDENWADENWD